MAIGSSRRQSLPPDPDADPCADDFRCGGRSRSFHGLFEAENASAEAYGETRLRDSIRERAGLPPAQLVQSVFTEVERFAEGQVFADDVCFVGMEIAQCGRGRGLIPSA